MDDLDKMPSGTYRFDPSAPTGPTGIVGDDLDKLKAPDSIWLHPITDDEFQDVWFADGADGDVEYVHAAALTEAQATIARQQVMLDRALEDVGAKMVEIGRLREALHDAINAPKGVVPKSAEPFYSADRAALAQARGMGCDG